MQHGSTTLEQLLQTLQETAESERANFVLQQGYREKILLLKSADIFKLIPQEDHLRLLQDDAFMPAFAFLVFDQEAQDANVQKNLREHAYNLPRTPDAALDQQFLARLDDLSLEALLYLGSREFYQQRQQFRNVHDDCPIQELNFSAFDRGIRERRRFEFPLTVWRKHLEGKTELEQLMLFAKLSHNRGYWLQPTKDLADMAQAVFGAPLPGGEDKPDADLRYALLDRFTTYDPRNIDDLKPFKTGTDRRIGSDRVLPDQIDATSILGGFNGFRSKARKSARLFDRIPVVGKMTRTTDKQKTEEDIKAFLRSNVEASITELLDFFLDQREALLRHHEGVAEIPLAEGERVASVDGATMAKINKWIVYLAKAMPFEGVVPFLNARQARVAQAQSHEVGGSAAVASAAPLSANPAGTVGGAAATAARTAARHAAADEGVEMQEWKPPQG